MEARQKKLWRKCVEDLTMYILKRKVSFKNGKNTEGVIREKGRNGCSRKEIKKCSGTASEGSENSFIFTILLYHLVPVFFVA